MAGGGRGDAYLPRFAQSFCFALLCALARLDRQCGLVRLHAALHPHTHPFPHTIPPLTQPSHYAVLSYSMQLLALRSTPSCLPPCQKPPSLTKRPPPANPHPHPPHHSNAGHHHQGAAPMPSRPGLLGQSGTCLCVPSFGLVLNTLLRLPRLRLAVLSPSALPFRPSVPVHVCRVLRPRDPPILHMHYQGKYRQQS